MNETARRTYWFSSRTMTVKAVTDKAGVIVDCAPVIRRRFTGQPLENLERWMRRQGGFRKVEINNVEDV